MSQGKNVFIAVLLVLLVLATIMIVFSWNNDQENNESLSDDLDDGEEMVDIDDVVLATLTMEEAQQIAMMSEECSMTGVLSDNFTYNNSSKTWWVDLDRMPELANDGCNPACVIWEATSTAEVNWRCTGLIAE
jgi:hypothetical protein